MLDRFVGWLLDPTGLTPHGFCLLWEPWLIWTHVAADIAIGLSYLSIPLVLMRIARRRSDFGFKPIFWLFAGFILLCGTGHLLDLLTLWVPAYGLQAVVKVATAIVSVLTAVALWPLLPRILALPSRTQMRIVNEELAQLAEERGRAVEALQASERRYRALVEASGSVVWRADISGAVVEGHGWRALTGQTDTALRQDGWLEALHHEDRGPAAAAWVLARAAGRPLDTEYRVRTPSGHGWRWVRARGVPVLDDQKRLVEWTGVVEDIHERRLAEERIRHLALHDGLTGLANRHLLRDQMQEFMDTRTGFAVLSLDLDGFKRVNDTRGHEAGDQLLVQVADRLRGAVRESDIVARVGGDEFVILQVGTTAPEMATALARRVIAKLALPFDINGQQAVTGTSIGIALHPNDGDCPENLLRNADAAVYRAKADGRGTSRRFDPTMNAEWQERYKLEAELRDAIAHEQLSLDYQPICDVRTHAVIGFEALARWSHPTLGKISPATFVPLAEECGLIIPLGRLILEKACAEAATWPRPLRVAVNLSPAQFRVEDLVGEIADVLARTGLPAKRLELEVTESLMIDDPQRVLATMRALKDTGVSISLDDFGTGHASLSYLRCFPFDKMKVDRSFVQSLGSDKGALPLLRAVKSLGDCLGLDVVVEGIETEAQLKVVDELGCTFVQGYLLGRPIPSEAVRNRLAEPLSV